MSDIKQPTYALLEVTWNCNLNCIMCPRNLFGSVGKRLNMSMEDFNNIIDKLPELRLCNFAGLGEPFTHPNLVDMFSILAKRDINVLMTTNGTFLTENMVKKLPDTHFSMHISIDTPIEDNFKKLRGYSLNTIINNLTNLKKIRNDINLVIQALFMKNTMKDFIHFIPIAKQLDAKIAVLYPISFKHENELEYEPFMESDFVEIKNGFTDKCKEEGIQLYDRPTEPMSKVCTEPWNGPMINPLGDMFPCCYIYEARHYPKIPDTWDEWYLNNKVTVPQHEYVMGNAIKDDIQAIWNSNSYNEIRDMVALCNSTYMKPNHYRELRNKINFKRKRFSYCRVCLWRYNQSC